MLTRQKVLLTILETAGRSVGRIELMKWCFLLRHESCSRGGSAFYDFVPDRLGPFSFGLYQEIGKLRDWSYIVDSGEQAWRYNPAIAPPGSGIGLALEREVRGIVSRFSHLSSDQLLDYVYERHPQYTVNSVRCQLATRHRADAAVYTAGYEGISIDRFFNLLVKAGIARLIDVRSNPVSRRYGFHKSTLDRLATSLGIDYIHLPELGIRSEQRRLHPADGGRDSLFADYEATTLIEESDTLTRLAGLVREDASVLVCMEADPRCCHRGRLAHPISAMTGLPIVHLRAEP